MPTNAARSAIERISFAILNSCLSALFTLAAETDLKVKFERNRELVAMVGDNEFCFYMFTYRYFC